MQRKPNSDGNRRIMYAVRHIHYSDGRDGVSNHQLHHRLLDRLFRRRSKKTSKLRVTGLCVGNSPVTGEFLAQMASNAELFPFDDVIMWVWDTSVSISLARTNHKQAVNIIASYHVLSSQLKLSLHDVHGKTCMQVTRGHFY